MFSATIYNSIFKQKKSAVRVLTVIGCLLMILQLAAIIYTNLFRLRYHIDYDSSINILNMLEKWSPLYGTGSKIITSGSGHSLSELFTTLKIQLFGGNAFLYYGVKNILVALTFTVICFRIFRKLNVSALAGVLALNILLCPYVTDSIHVLNDLGYFATMFSVNGYYGKRIILELLIILNVLDLKSGRKNIVLLIVSAVYTVNFGMVKGLYMLGTIFVPLLICIVADAIITRKAKKTVSPEMIYILSLTVLLAAAKFAVKLFFSSSAMDEQVTAVSFDNLLYNICSVGYGFMNLIGLFIKKDTTALNGLQYIANFIIFAAFFTAVICYVIKLLKKDERALDFFPFFAVAAVVFGINFLVNSPFEAEAKIRGSRHLLSAMISMAFLIAYFIDSLKPDRTFKKLCAGILLTSVTFSTVMSYKIYKEKELPLEAVDTLIEKVSEFDAPVVYGCGSEKAFGDTDASYMAWNMRALDHTHAYKGLFENYEESHDYSYFSDNAFYSGSTLIMAAQNDFEALPEYIRNKYELKYVEPRTKVSLYYSGQNPFDISSRLTNGKTRELMYSKAITVGNGMLTSDGTLISDGTAGRLFTYCPAENGKYQTHSGVYDITMTYSLSQSIEDGEAIFSVMAGDQNNIFASAVLDKTKNSVTLKGVTVENDGDCFACTVDVARGITLEIMSTDFVSRTD